MSAQRVRVTSVRKTASWPYAFGLVSALLGAAGLAYAPFSLIVYPLALLGVCVSAVWAIAQRSPMRVPLAVALLLLASGFVLANLAIFPVTADWLWGGINSPVFIQDTAVLFMLGLPALALVVAIPAAAMALRRPGTTS